MSETIETFLRIIKENQHTNIKLSFFNDDKSSSIEVFVKDGHFHVEIQKKSTEMSTTFSNDEFEELVSLIKRIEG